MDYNQLLVQYKNIITPTETEYLEITPTIAKEIDPFTSKIFGLPYLPLPKKEQNIFKRLFMRPSYYPKNKNGKDLYLLAQINFSEIPAMDPFPEKGILQFWIDDDSMYGLSENNLADQSNFRILYYPDIQKDILDKETNFIPKTLPINGNKKNENFLSNIMQYGYKLEFKKKKMHITSSDQYLHDAYINKSIPENIIDIIQDTLYEAEYGYGCRIKGYPRFCQEDPRTDWDKDTGNFNILLLQIDSLMPKECSTTHDIEIGDAGVMNFFINEDKLRARDFSDVIYWWDCH